MKTIRALVLFTLCSCILPHPTTAFIQQRSLNGEPVRWDLSAVQPNISGGTVVYTVNKTGSDDVPDFITLAATVELAFNTWQGANGSVIGFTRVVDPSPLSSGTIQNNLDQVNVIRWEEDPRGLILFPERALGVTIRRADPDTGVLLDADIVLNASQFLWTNAGDSNFTSLTGPVDIQTTLTAAIGEFIGLNRVPTAGQVMQEAAYPGSIAGRTLAQDELAAALDLYPPTPDPSVTSISGQVSQSGQGVFGAYVTAFKEGVPVVGALTGQDGTYSIRRIPSDTYTVRVLTVNTPGPSPFFNTFTNDFLSESFNDLATDPATSVVAMAGMDTPNISFDVATANTDDPWEPDNTLEDATDISTDGTRQIHHTSSLLDEDWVTFPVTQGNFYSIETSNLGSGVVRSDTKITLTDSSGNVLATNDDRNAKQASKQASKQNVSAHLSSCAHG